MLNLWKKFIINVCSAFVDGSNVRNIIKKFSFVQLIGLTGVFGLFTFLALNARVSLGITARVGVTIAFTSLCLFAIVYTLSKTKKTTVVDMSGWATSATYTNTWKSGLIFLFVFVFLPNLVLQLRFFYNRGVWLTFKFLETQPNNASELTYYWFYYLQIFYWLYAVGSVCYILFTYNSNLTKMMNCVTLFNKSLRYFSGFVLTEQLFLGFLKPESFLFCHIHASLLLNCLVFAFYLAVGLILVNGVIYCLLKDHQYQRFARNHFLFTLGWLALWPIGVKLWLYSAVKKRSWK